MKRWVQGSIGGATALGLILTAAATGMFAESVAIDLAQPIKVNTATVTISDLAETHTSWCPVGLGETYTLVANDGGTATSLPNVGDVITAGNDLFRLDDQPVTKLRGDLPAWRDFGPGMSRGRDVAQLRMALTELGFGNDLGEDDRWSASLTNAVRDFNEARGLRRSPYLPAASIAFLPHDVRVADVVLQIGTRVQPGALVLTYTGTAAQLLCTLPGDMSRFGYLGATVQVEPRGAPTEPGEVLAATDSALEPGARDVIVATSAQLAVGETVRVVFTEVVAEQATVVPVTALVVFVGGGFGVQLVHDDGALTYVPVQLRGFADALVAIESDHLTVGDRVVIP